MKKTNNQSNCFPVLVQSHKDQILAMADGIMEENMEAFLFLAKGTANDITS